MARGANQKKCRGVLLTPASPFLFCSFDNHFFLVFTQNNIVGREGGKAGKSRHRRGCKERSGSRKPLRDLAHKANIKIVFILSTEG